MPAITGVVGMLKWAYVLAAGIHDFTITRHDDGTWTLAGRLGVSDAFKLQQRPLTFHAPHKAGEWRWPVRALAVEANQVTATLGRLEDVTR